MKKVFLLCALVCAGQMYSMEKEKSDFEWQYLPAELRAIIVSYLHTYKELSDVVCALKVASRTNKELNKMINMGNLTGFTILVHKLADQFDMTTAQVASEFNTPIAGTYLRLGYALLDFAGSYLEEHTIKLGELIKQGADVNFSSHKTPLYLAIENSRVGQVKSFINAGAKPTGKDWNAAIDREKLCPTIEALIIKQLIEKAMQEQSSVTK